jgi:hypothetical protein
MNHPAPEPHQLITTALEDWWITADPSAPFNPADTAEMIHTYLGGHGFIITADTCDTSTLGAVGGILGPCVLRRHHDGPVHQNAYGTTWSTRTPEPSPSRATITFTAFLVLAALAGTLTCLARGNWGWTIVAATVTCLLGNELRDETTQRLHSRRKQT